MEMEELSFRTSEINSGFDTAEMVGKVRRLLAAR
jgi:hypothetical protein